MKVDITRRATPPDDVASILALGILDPEDGEWVRFSTVHAWAYVFVARDRTSHSIRDGGRAGYLLHWIESRLPGEGHGTAVLKAIGAFGDRLYASGHLVCEPELVGWYENHDWQPVGEFGGSVVMARFYRPNRSTGPSPRR